MFAQLHASPALASPKQKGTAPFFQTETAININKEAKQINREAKRKSTESDCYRSQFVPL